MVFVKLLDGRVSTTSMRMVPAIITAPVPQPQLTIRQTSLNYTAYDNITIEEIFQLTIYQSLPEGYVNLTITTGIYHTINIATFSLPHLSFLCIRI